MGTVSKNFTMPPTTSESDLPPRTESLQICAQFAINTVVKYFLNNSAAWRRTYICVQLSTYETMSEYIRLADAKELWDVFI